MGIPVFILGESGSGKSTSLRNLNPDQTIVLQAVKKPLPFRNAWKPWSGETKIGSIAVTDNSARISLSDPARPRSASGCPGS